MASLAIPVKTVLRRLRGGSQALLVKAADEKVYVAKCAGNPQGDRTLINEWIVTGLLKQLKASTPDVRPLHVNKGVPGDDLLEFSFGNRRIAIREGVHLGSLCPVDPACRAIFDFLPRHLLPKIVNLSDFILAFVFDRWVNQLDTRQAIFVRERCAGPTGKFRAYLIDHGLSFGGSRWELSQTVLQGLYYDVSVYSTPSFEAECHNAADKIQILPEESVHSAGQNVPAEWFADGDREDLARLTDALLKRRAVLHDTLTRAVRELRERENTLPKRHSEKLLWAVLLLLAFVQQFSNFCRPNAVEYSQAPQGKPLHVVANTRDLVAGPALVELVDKYGARMWRGNAVLGSESIETNLPAISESGVYFFRVYERSQSGAPEVLLREYVLVVKKK